MSADELWDIPHSWAWTKIKELGAVVSGGTPSTKDATLWGREINWISPADLTGWVSKTISHGAKGLSRKGLEKSSAKLMPAGSVHFSSRAPIGYVVISAKPLATNQGFKSLVPVAGVFNEYVYYYLKASKPLAERRASGTTFLELSGAAFGEIPFPLAPAGEQKRIVAKLEELFSELDKGIENLNTAREQLKVYRQAVLKHAFEGKLTARWREQNQDKLESPDELLARIEHERKDRYEQQVEGWKAAVKQWEVEGKLGKKPKKPRSAMPVELPDTPLLTLPNGWAWECLGNLNVDVFDGPFGSNLRTSDYVDQGVRVIRLENVGFLEFIEDKHSYVTEEKYESINKHTVHSGDLIFSSFVSEGIRVAILPEHIDRAVNKADCFCVRLHGETIRADFLAHFLSTMSAYKQIEAEIHGVGRPRINTTQLKAFAIPICSIEEQRQVMTLVSDKLSIADHISHAIDEEIDRSEALRQGILKRAFSGLLVDQNSDEEPASALLERIKAEREQRGTKKTKRKNAA
jgi:type I restriction enzyme S subunit